jgi:hypothetical protein
MNWYHACANRWQIPHAAEIRRFYSEEVSGSIGGHRPDPLACLQSAKETARLYREFRP